MRIGLLFVCAIIGLTLTSSKLVNKTFEGKIVYKLTYQNLPEEMEGFESMLPQNMSMYFKGAKVRLEQTMGMGGSQVILTDNDTKTSDLLMDMMGQKIHIHIPKEEIEKAEETAEAQEITYLDGTKKILGYSCKKAEIKNGEDVTTVFYTDKLKITHKDFNKLEGFPLEYTTDQNGMTIILSATEVKKEDLSETLFEVPLGYQQMTMEELENMTGGNN